MIPISPDTHGFIGSPKLTDKIHCVAFVIDCCTVDVIPEKVIMLKNCLKGTESVNNLVQIN
jgi:hypothetical protein